MRLRVVRACALLCWSLIICVVAVGATTDSTSTTTTQPKQAKVRYPDDGYLSNYRYANAFFGFSVDLPADASLRPMSAQAAADGSVALLEMFGSPGKSMLTIAAYPPAENRPDARLMLRHELDNELTIGVEELHGLTKTSIAGHQFFYFETRRGIDQHAVYATDLDGYVLRFVTAGHDAKLLQRLESAVMRMRFFPPASIGDFAGVGAVAYNGPAMPYHVLQQLKANPPAQKLDAGFMSGNVYENHEIGIQYELPKGWRYGTQAAVVPAVERSRQENTGKPAVQPYERMLLNACERTLISAWRIVPQQSGAIAYDDFGEVTISAMSLECFPNVKFPSVDQGEDALRDFVVAYGVGHPILRDMKGARAFERQGRTFIVMEGVIAFKDEGDELSRRVSVALALTRQRGYVLSFFFAAPHEAELHDLMNDRASFDPDTPLVAAKAPAAASDTHVPPETPQPDESSGNPKSPASLPAAAGDSPPASTASAPNPDTSADAKPQPASDSASSASTSSSDFHPSLLRPGETMQDQKIQGKPLPKKK